MFHGPYFRHVAIGSLFPPPLSLSLSLSLDLDLDLDLNLDLIVSLNMIQKFLQTKNYPY